MPGNFGGKSMQPTYQIIQESSEPRDQLCAQSINESAINESAMNESIEHLQPISAIIARLLEKYELLDDDDPPVPPALDDHFTYGSRWGSVLKESNHGRQCVSSVSVRLD